MARWRGAGAEQFLVTFSCEGSIQCQRTKDKLHSDADEQLMLRVQDGDVEALGALYQRHRTPLFNFFLRLSGSAPSSEDLVQDVFLRMLKYRHTFATDGRFTTWMFQIARNALRDSWRKRRVEARFEPQTADVVDSFRCPAPTPD